VNADPVVMTLAVIYERPRDAPEHYIVRRQRVGLNGEVTPEERAYGFRGELDAHRWIAQEWPEMVLLHTRGVDPDPTIVAVYV
jgi:hypothetical protein